ncbi:FIST N-terminal domain-containing protein [Sphaerisporangium sp. TRM90804]|uniref:FIST signal transduction protein n=1 Tax=Sphaerisporangium sp. TRM90804 TaxID=3031113 RepID=UPI00244C068A|nr:FIST N-terminal domain-containing protein [Sphaerisporangium sp. TRM90804]MDH2428788.1 FIST N-terminal domain-containing protein [Sphaerisporangium sp. TRM90804]
MAVLTSRFADGLAVGSDLVIAAETAVRQALSGLSGPPDLLCFFICGDDPDEVSRAGLRAMRMAPGAEVIGCSATGVIGDNQGVELTPAVSAWAASLDGARVTSFVLETLRMEDRFVIIGLPDRDPDDRVAVLLADPYSFPTDAFVENSADVLGNLPLVGGLANGMGGQGSVRLFAGGEMYTEGAVGVMLSGSIDVSTVVSQGCRPIGPTMVVTRSEDNLLLELAGQPALARLEDIVSALDEEDRELVAAGLQIGVAMDEYAEIHERGDFLIRGILGIDPEREAVAVGDVLDIGQSVRFQVRDAASADEDLYALLDAHVEQRGRIDGALLFACNGRGSAMFGSSDHDALAVRDTLGAIGMAGFFAAGEVGPVAGQNHVHGFSAALLVFSSSNGSGGAKAARGAR